MEAFDLSRETGGEEKQVNIKGRMFILAKIANKQGQHAGKQTNKQTNKRDKTNGHRRYPMQGQQQGPEKKDK